MLAARHQEGGIASRWRNSDVSPERLRRRIVFVETGSLMGGVEWSTLYLAQHLERARWEPVVVCPEEGDLPKACRHAGIRVQLLRRPLLRSTSFRIGTRMRLPNPAACAWDIGVIILAARSLARLLGKLQPNLVVTKGLIAHFYGGLAARWTGVPCLWHAQDFISERCWGLFRRCFAEASRWLPTRVVVDGGPIARQLPATVQDRVHVIHNGVDTRAFRPGLDGTSVRQELGIPAQALVVGHVARMTPWKGQRYLLESFARIAHHLPRLRLLLVGAPVFDGDAYERSLRQRAAAIGLLDRVIFPGYRHDLPQVLAAMDVFAYPSLEKDTAPLALLSAMAAGLPIAAFDIEGVREVVADQHNGILVPVGQVERLAHGIARILTDDALRQRLALGSRRRVEEAFSLERHVDHFEEVFLDLLNGEQSNS